MSFNGNAEYGIAKNRLRDEKFANVSPTECSVCGSKPAVFVAAFKGFCVKHKDDAKKAMAASTIRQVVAREQFMDKEFYIQKRAEKKRKNWLK